MVVDALERRRLLSGVFGIPLYDTPVLVAVVADFNGDGRVDTASSGSPNVGSTRISVRLQGADGVFGPGQTAATTRAANLVAGNFAGDAKPDLVFTAADGSLNFSRNLGDGTFAASVSIASGVTVRQAVDFNGDGNLDLVTTAGTTVRIYLGNGAGAFVVGATATDSSVASVTAADFNGDAKPDIATVNSSDSKVNLFLNSAGTSLVAASTLSLGGGGGAITSGDFNGDGKPDIAAVATGGILEFMNLGRQRALSLVILTATTNAISPRSGRQST